MSRVAFDACKQQAGGGAAAGLCTRAKANVADANHHSEQCDLHACQCAVGGNATNAGGMCDAVHAFKRSRFIRSYDLGVGATMEFESNCTHMYQVKSY